jgi:6-phosphogluconolactonase
MARPVAIFGAFSALAGLVTAGVARRRALKPIRLFIGTQDSGPGQGIFTAELDPKTGALHSLRPAAEVARPTWLLADPGRAMLYAVSEVGNAGDRDGEVLSFAIARADGQLRPAGSTGSGGGGATHLDYDHASGALFVANFGGGSVAAIPVAADGTLAPTASLQITSGSGPHRRQQGPHPHGVTLDPERRHLLVPDMGADRIFVYRFVHTTRTLAAHDVPFVALPPGSGPRLILFGRDGRFAYLLSELSAEIFTFRWDAAAGRLGQIGVTRLDEPGVDESTRSAAAIVRSGDGRFLYTSNRRSGEIVVHAIDRHSGILSFVQRISAGGAKPWGAEIAPGGRWLVVANQGSDAIIAFRIDRRTGRLSRVEGGLSVPTPTCIAFA